ncbi:MAG: amidohydrolase [candidate division KSB1 bacterium]|nr:amidohydrolase [candidate division KSB1 bacterium]
MEPDLIQYRRHLHQHPELGYQEQNTARYLTELLRSFGLTPRRVAGTGLLVDIGEAPARIGFRADMDALPIREETGLPYASQNSGVMHACGHDVHMAVALGVARALVALREHLTHGVRLLFQPAEELMPGGAADMIRDGAIEGLEAIYALHVEPTLPAGTVGLKYGPFLASVDTFDIELRGKMGHAGYPHRAVDPVPAAAELVLALQTLVARKTDPVSPAVFSITELQAGEAKNIIPAKVHLGGTYRCLDAAVREQIPHWLEDMLAGICRAHGLEYKLSFEHGSPVLVNDEHCTRKLEQVCRQVLGDDRVVILQEPRLGAEDFSFYLEHIPGTLMRLGVQTDPAQTVPLHSPRFAPDERAMAVGAQVMTALMLDF